MVGGSCRREPGLPGVRGREGGSGMREPEVAGGCKAVEGGRGVATGWEEAAAGGRGRTTGGRVPGAGGSPAVA